jgi:hypothetical protein
LRLVFGTIGGECLYFVLGIKYEQTESGVVVRREEKRKWFVLGPGWFMKADLR